MICPVVMYAPRAAMKPTMASCPLVLSACSMMKSDSFSFINLAGVSLAKIFCLPYSVVVVMSLIAGRSMAMMKVQVATNCYDQLDVDSVPAAQVSPLGDNSVNVCPDGYASMKPSAELVGVTYNTFKSVSLPTVLGL